MTHNNILSRLGTFACIVFIATSAAAQLSHEGFALGMIVHTNADPKKIEDIQVGDLVLSKDLAHDIQVVCPVTHICKEIIPSYVEIVLDHETITTALGQKFYLESLNDFVTVQELMHSPELQAQFPETILEIRQVNGSIEIYKLTVAHEHSFYVTEKQLLAHNFIPMVAVGTVAVPSIVIPIVKGTAAATFGWIASKFLKSFYERKKEREQQGKEKAGQSNADQKQGDHTKRDKDKKNPEKKKSKANKQKASAPGGPGGPNGPNDPNWPPKKNGNNNKKPDNDDKDKKNNDEKKKPGEKNQEEEHPNGDYEEAPYHHQNSKGRKGPAPKNGQKALDDSIPLDEDGNTPRRLSIDGEDFVVLDQTSKGKFHGHTRTWAELRRPMRDRLIKEGFANKKGKIIK